MTELSKVVVRKVQMPDGRTMVVSLTREGIYFREARQRTSYLLPFATAYSVAGKMAGAALLSARKARTR